MSYCRWSSDDWQSDLYVWADVSGGWRAEVAARRFIFNEIPPPVDLPRGFTDEQFHAWHRRSMDLMHKHGDENHGRWLDLAEPPGGRSYWHATPGECADNLERLRRLGYNVPVDAVQALREEEAERWS